MKPDDREQTEQLFHDLAPLEPAERASQLADVTDRNPLLGAEVESLLTAHDSPGVLDELTSTIAPAPIGRDLAAPTTRDPLPGTTIGQYTIGELIGTGGMGDVYRARDTKLGRDVAVKFLPLWLSRDPAARDRFVVEARVISSIDDTNVCALFDLGETDDGRLFLVMPYYEGRTLKQRLIAEGPLPIPRAVEIALQTARGLAAAHKRGIVHRDIKPANLLLTEGGQVKVLDFGVAKLTDLTLTRPGENPGTLAYMSPEQREGREVDERSDLWSLGAVLFEMLTGKQPAGDASQVRQAVSPMSPALANILVKLVAASPTDRYPDAPAVVEDIKRWFRKANYRPAWRTFSRWRARVLPVLGAAALIAAATFLAKREPGFSPQSVAVLPFSSLTDDEDSRVFAIGLHDDLTTQLSRVEGLSVVSRASVVSLADTVLSAGEIGTVLGVGSLLRSTVRMSGGRVKLNIQLVSAPSDDILWAESYDRAITAENVFGIQAEIAQAVAGVLSAELSPETRAALSDRPTESLEAWNAYNRARVHADGIGEEYSALRAEAEAETATQLDSTFLAAWNLLVLTRSWLMRGGLVADTLPTFEALQHLRQLSADSPARHSAEGYYQYYAHADYPAALSHLLRAREGDSSDREVAEFSAYVMRRLGRWGEAIETLEPIVRVDPRNHRVAWNQALSLSQVGQFEEAGRLYEVALKLQPSSQTARAYFVDMRLFGEGDIVGAASVAERAPGFIDESYAAVSKFWRAYFSRDYPAAIEAIRDVEGIQLRVPRAVTEAQPEERTLLLALAYAMMGDRPNATVMADSAVEVALAELPRRPTPDPVDRFGITGRVHGTVALALAIRGGEGDDSEAVRHAEMAVQLYGFEQDALGGGHAEWTLARVYMLTGRHEDALRQLEKLLAEPGPIGPGALRLDPIWDPVRDDERFVSLVQERERFTIH